MTIFIGASFQTIEQRFDMLKNIPTSTEKKIILSFCKIKICIRLGNLCVV